MLHTKTDYIECLEKIINPLKDYFTPGKAGIKCGSTATWYGESVCRMEGFARLLWGLAPLWSKCDNCENFARTYIDGIKNGTNPESEEYWGEISDCDQRIVETAAMGLALILAPHKIWEPLSTNERENLYNWLNQVNKVKSVDNNWNFFCVLVNMGFKNIGMPYDKERINFAISRFEKFYIGNGWYRDGETDQSDYYISFAIHFYSLIYAKVMEDDDPENSRKYKERAERFAKDFIYWFDEKGRALAFGRSLTYRFAQCCFWSACVFAGVKPFPLGVIKGIISRNLEHWLSLPIFDNAGILTIGYGYSNLMMSESYNGFGSPYWALKAFLILALDSNDEFFKAEPLPLPTLENLHIIPEANMVIQRISDYTVALTSGQWASFLPENTPEKYSKFAYSSKYAFSVSRSYLRLETAGTDNMLTFEDDGMFFVRQKCISYSTNADGTIDSVWSPKSGIVVKTHIIPAQNGHIREHSIECDREYNAYDCAFSLPNNGGEISGDGELINIQSVNLNLLYNFTTTKAIKYSLKKGINKIRTTIVYPD